MQQTLEAGETHHALATLKRLLTILKTLVSQVDVLETMTPMSFSSFRHHLDRASGFESVQFRLVEFTLGHKRSTALSRYPEGSPERLQLQRALEARSVWDSFVRYLLSQGFAVPEAVLARDVREPIEPSLEMQERLGSGLSARRALESALRTPGRHR